MRWMRLRVLAEEMIDGGGEGEVGGAGEGCRRALLRVRHQPRALAVRDVGVAIALVKRVPGSLDV